MALRSQLAALDRDLSQRLAQFADGHPARRKIAIVLAHSGDSPLWIAGLLLVWWLGPGDWAWAAKIDLIGIGFTALVVQMIKWCIRRPRPAGDWGYYRRIDPHSFPSGHAARATMLAVVALFLGPVWWSVILWVWSVLVILARVVMRVHYVSDVVAGAGCGAVCGLVLGIWLT